ncbi:SnoaL-like protein [Rhodoglobus vestalii]|uniref:SnoaL-like protein n=1 Tax=Rhodoglobus vestalii TaxID=193384 RepID=A0A8H2K638_9MICO|nr:nuclear transport factor 2 family protein [Rhodoglobus vestalii]TQO19850.1 SnoaL-like protein [Rhodoglobus vestalii]
MEQATSTVTDSTNTSLFDPDQLAIWDAQKAMYSSFLKGDSSEIDNHIHAKATVWDAVTEKLARGIDDLNEIRATRPVGASKPVVTRMEVSEPVIDVSGTLAVSRHFLRVDTTNSDGSNRELMRVSQGWRQVEGKWLIIHAHEDLFSIEER